MTEVETLPSGWILETVKDEVRAGRHYAIKTEREKSPHQMLREELEKAKEGCPEIGSRIEPEALLNFELFELAETWEEDIGGERVSESKSSWRRGFSLKPKGDDWHELIIYSYTVGRGKEHWQVSANWRRQNGFKQRGDPFVGVINGLYLGEGGNLIIEGWSELTSGNQEWIVDRTQRMEITPRGEVFWQILGRMCWRKPLSLEDLKARVERIG